MMNIVYIILLSIVSAILYRLGGASEEDQDKEFPWIPRWFKNLQKKRDVGCTLCTLGSVAILGIHAQWWVWVLCFGMMWGALSTYWDFLFGFDNHWFHGFMCGVALVLFGMTAGWLWVGLRCLALAILMGGWSALVGNAKWEEMGRGFVLPITILML